MGITRCPETVGVFVYVLLLLTVATGKDLILHKLFHNISIPLVANHLLV